MMDICLNRIGICGNRIEYYYVWNEKLDPFFSKSERFFIEYTDVDFDFCSVPTSVLAVPFVVNLLPLCWVENLSLSVPEIDRAFMNSIPQIKAGFQSIYPTIPLGGTVCANEVKENTYEVSHNTVCLFSGGVDAVYTLLRHKQEKPTLINVWGVDVSLDDTDGHIIMNSHCKKVAEEFDLDYMCVRSTLRTFLNEKYLNKELYNKIHDYWWHGAQHSIGLLSILAPYNYIMKTCTNYIASSFTEKEFQMGVKCVSYPVVDEALRFASTKMVHDGFESQRIEKIRYICEFLHQENKSLELKVCFHFEDGKNCCSCEKCYRTMMAILIFDPDLARYGFHLDHQDARKIRWFLQQNQIGTFRWEPIRQAYIENDSNRNIRWFKSLSFNETKSLKSRIQRAWAKIERLIDRMSLGGTA